MTFQTLGLSQPLLRALTDSGYTQPTAVQSAAIKPIIEGRDLMAAAQTGTGKTAAFTLPLLEKLLRTKATGASATVLIVTPTRELAAQIEASITTYAKYTSLKGMAVFGGVKIGPQITKLKGALSILVATPGRLLDLSNQGAVSLKNIEVLVLDEADRMLDMGFLPDIKRIQKLLPPKKQTLMFSATYSPEIRTLAKSYLVDPVDVSVTPTNAAADTVKQVVYPVDKSRKSALLRHLLHTHGWSQVLVFSRTKHGANKLVKELLKDDIRAAAIHGNRSQAQRTKALDEFKRGKLTVLVATDIAARGIDISELPMVINFDLPQVAEDYVHRIGRTGRAGANGRAISLVCDDEFKQLNAIERVIKRLLPREDIHGFEPEKPLPESKLGPARNSGQASTKKPGTSPKQQRSGNSGRDEGAKKPSGGRSRRRRRGGQATT